MYLSISGLTYMVSCSCILLCVIIIPASWYATISHIFLAVEVSIHNNYRYTATHHYDFYTINNSPSLNWT